MLVYARNGMVATSQPLAAQAGLEVLRRGGNAVDAAVATAAALTVLEPTSNGIGSDAFALVWSEGRLHGLNASGPAPALASAEELLRRGYREVPLQGWAAVTVPGAPAAWAELQRRFGRRPLAELLEPAARYAEEGYPLSPVLGAAWAAAVERYRSLAREEPELYRPWLETFAPEGVAPAIGGLWRSPAHARTLRTIGASGADAFYRGELAEAMDAFARRTGGWLRAGDLAVFRPEWVEPLSVRYRGVDVWELPPNGQGLVALMALQLLESFDPPSSRGWEAEAERIHRAVEAVKLAFEEGFREIADPRAMRLRPEELLNPDRAAARRRRIGAHAFEPEPGPRPAGGTVYLCTADGEGNMVSYIQSNFGGFGSGVVVPGTGIALQNRGACFTLQEGHPNRLEPGKRPYHTIIPGFLSRDGVPLGPFGVMGGLMQPQGHVQLLTGLVDLGLNPQAALDAPRWRWIDGRRVEFEPGTPPHLVEALARRGHEVSWAAGSASFGRGQLILRLEEGVLAGASEPRADGQVAAW
ncbi:MAG: gamma-glutamyltransferase family protein [Bacillota bacterium]|nr:gamma-glutamyltransferase family protein [Bacillota bacterium]